MEIHKLIINTIDENKLKTLSSTNALLSNQIYFVDDDLLNRTVIPSYDLMSLSVNVLNDKFEKFNQTILGLKSEIVISIDNKINDINQLCSSISSYEDGSFITFKDKDGQDKFYSISSDSTGNKIFIETDYDTALFVKNSNIQKDIDFSNEYENNNSNVDDSNEENNINDDEQLMSHTLFSTKYESKDYDSIENELSLVLNVLIRQLIK